MLGLPRANHPQSKTVEVGNRQGMHVLCISVAQGGGEAESSTFPVHKVNVSDKRHQMHGA